VHHPYLPLHHLLLLLTVLLLFSQKKIDKLRLSLAAICPHTPSLPVTASQFPIFKPATESEISNILFNCPNRPRQSDSHPIPTWLLKKCDSVLVPTVTNIVNLSLSSGQFHPILKEPAISLPLKKSTLDKDQL